MIYLMAQQFLDLQGLQTLWAKVKEKIQANIQDKVGFHRFNS